MAVAHFDTPKLYSDGLLLLVCLCVCYLYVVYRMPSTKCHFYPWKWFQHFNYGPDLLDTVSATTIPGYTPCNRCIVRRVHPHWYCNTNIHIERVYRLREPLVMPIFLHVLPPVWSCRHCVMCVCTFLCPRNDIYFICYHSFIIYSSICYIFRLNSMFFFAFNF
jgi:hypothetical protein